MTKLKERIHQIIDDLPRPELPVAERFLEFLRDAGSDPCCALSPLLPTMTRRSPETMLRPSGARAGTSQEATSVLTPARSAAGSDELTVSEPPHRGAGTYVPPR